MGFVIPSWLFVVVGGVSFVFTFPFRSSYFFFSLFLDTIFIYFDCMFYISSDWRSPSLLAFLHTRQYLGPLFRAFRILAACILDARLAYSLAIIARTFPLFRHSKWHENLLTTFFFLFSSDFSFSRLARIRITDQSKWTLSCINRFDWLAMPHEYFRSNSQSIEYISQMKWGKVINLSAQNRTRQIGLDDVFVSFPIAVAVFLYIQPLRFRLRLRLILSAITAAFSLYWYQIPAFYSTLFDNSGWICANFF